MKQNYSDIPNDFHNTKSEDISSSDSNVIKEDEKGSLKKEMRAALQDSSPDMMDEIFSGLSRDMHIVVCGSPRVGKSTLINVICGKEVAKSGEGLDSVTQSISCYTVEGQCNTESNIINYKYNYWDTPGFESWEKDNIKSKVKEIIEKPETKPLCMIFCASPGTFVDLKQLEWLLNLCINKKHIFCALVCTNKYAGQLKSRRAVLDNFNKLLSKYIHDSPRIENDITFYGNVGLCAAVNSEPYETDDRILPPSGVNELIYGIMESLVDEQVLNWCLVVLENQKFWNDCQQKFSGLKGDLKGKIKAVRKLFGKNKTKVKTNQVTFSRQWYGDKETSNQ